jgi:hypothetical protein
MPVEKLAQLLLQCARADTALPRREPANDDEAPTGFLDSIPGRDESPSPSDMRSRDDMRTRLADLESLRLEPRAMRLAQHVSLPVIPPVDVASNEDLEELVALALTSAHDAEDISREANAASRRAKRGTTVAVAVAVLGVMVATTGAVGARLFYHDDAQQMAAITKQVQTLGDLQRSINDQLAQMKTQAATRTAPTQEASAEPPDSTTPPARHEAPVPAVLPPLKTTVVQPFPAPPPRPQTTEAALAQPPAIAQATIPDPPPVTYASAGYTVPPHAPPYQRHVVYARHWAPYHPPVPHYRTQIALPRPVVYFIGSVQRDVRALFR